MNRKLAVLVFASAMVMVIGIVSPAFAQASTYDDPYTVITGTLGKADYVLYMPHDWNGRLIIGCPGYNYYETPSPELNFDALGKSLATNGYAFAASNYNGGERAWLNDVGMIRIHQLTLYLMHQYHVTDKVFLVGASMGGGIALLLGEKYPMLYAGVLDVCGNKGDPYQYEYAQIFMTHTVSEIRAILSLPPTVSDTAIESLQAFFNTIVADKIEENHGTMEERPRAYDRENTLLHADIHIPVISVVGAIDPIVPLQVHIHYQDAVASEGKSSLYRMYIVPNGGHLDTPVMNEVPGHLMELIAWSDSLRDHHCGR